ncbi:PucR family transcriptional regulator [Nocardia goodfellowii]|uniref:PucR C-terminal helix-turn-helix domain-containing protein n=1 Tax=Nocardia goodfellowii TaxID=882446 RepID=A0ABS4QNC2_9NOCA|nr:PucR family transcriptional regulator [Nocardia goodfellowii]MBP2193197.1 hypothetical protein [Nocardia goodfellowii]
MPTSSTRAQELHIAGVPAVVHLRRNPRLSQQLLTHVAGPDAAPGTRMACGVAWDEAVEVVGGCVNLIAAALQGRPPAKVPAALDTRIGDWAAEGVELEAVHQLTHAGFRFALDVLARRATSADRTALTAVEQRVGAVQETVVTSFASAYLRQIRAEAASPAAAAEALATALITGAPAPVRGAGGGAHGDEEYAVLALAHGHRRDDDTGRTELGTRRWLRRLRAELAARPGGSLPALLDDGGGIVLIPRPDEHAPAELFGRLQIATQTPLRAALVHARTGQVPEAARAAEELLDLAERLHRPAGLYRMRDLVLEYQITRPGPGRARLASILKPLRDHPELIETLVTYLRFDRNRQLAARAQHVHPNTVDYRLRRIETYTGMDPSHIRGLWYLQAALVAEAHETGARQPMSSIFSPGPADRRTESAAESA